ncbi:MAG TPA: hypothetical protein VFB58_09305 [Chloroflexota bacterium]|nr:hypothetical protein [Chloroflexota bacterium]
MTAEAQTQDQDQQQADQTPPTNNAGTSQAHTASHSETTPAQGAAEDQAGPQAQANQSDRTEQQRSKPLTYVYNPSSAIQAGLINLATQWKETGAVYQAIHAYTEVLTRYPNTGAAAAATEGLLDLASKLEQEGRFYAALSIFHKLEVLV